MTWETSWSSTTWMFWGEPHDMGNLLVIHDLDVWGEPHDMGNLHIRVTNQGILQDHSIVLPSAFAKPQAIVVTQHLWPVTRP